MTALRHVIALLALGSCLIATAAPAQGLRERQAERKPVIDALLAEGAIGINNIGLLEYVGDELHLAVVKAENEDRIKVYKVIAKKTDKTINDVGTVMARKIHDKAPSGTWLQSFEGRWYQKR